MTWIPLLLADKSTTLRYLVLRNLLHKEESNEEVQELEGISTSYTKFVGNPFYNMFHKGRDAAIQDMDDEYEPRLDEIDESEKMNDPYFNNEE